MYDYLEGEVGARSATRLVVDVGGVGYDVLVPLGLKLPTSGRVRVWTHLTVREDAHLLYGFPDRATRELFRLLLSVRGVGPTMALGVVSGLGRAELVDAIVHGDLARLTRIRGVGKKTAEQILLDLRDRAVRLAEAGGLEDGEVLTPARAPASRGETNVQDAVAALVSVGYSKKEASAQVERAARSVDPNDLDALVRAALQG